MAVDALLDEVEVAEREAEEVMETEEESSSAPRPPFLPFPESSVVDGELLEEVAVADEVIKTETEEEEDFFSKNAINEDKCKSSDGEFHSSFSDWMMTIFDAQYLFIPLTRHKWH